MTVCLGTQGNDFVLNGKLQDVNAEEIFDDACLWVWCRLRLLECCPDGAEEGARRLSWVNLEELTPMCQFLKFGLTTEALQSYLPLFEGEFYDFLSHSPAFQGFEGSICVTKTMAELTILTASRTLQGKEVRQKFDSTFAELYHDLDMGFTPVNFMMP